MENQSSKPNQESPKVVSLFQAKQQQALQTQKEQSVSEKQDSSSPAFEDAMRKNQENAERLRKERLKANQGVLKSYRIKN